jgi:ribosomal protein S18 acetylase RimI-like enzyme
MEIRVPDLADLNACVQLDGSYTTDYVWQMRQERPSAMPSGVVTVVFQSVRLPRSVRVPYPRPSDELVEHWQRPGCFLVAAEGDEVVGFADARPVPWNASVHIENLIVASGVRGRGIGTLLLDAVAEWARTNGLHQLVLEAQTKNVPAIRFYQKNGAVFCGFNDHYYPNRDVAVFFSRPA